MMKVTLQISSLLFGLVLWSTTAWAQPSNDDCSDAFEVVFADVEANVVKTDGDSRGATASTTPISVCSSTFYTDDTWYYFTTPAVMPAGAITMRAYFGDIPGDVTAVGMALYESCASSAIPISCFSSSVPEDDRISLAAMCMLANHTYFLRVWSTGNTSATEGTFRLGVYAEPYKPDNILWVDRFDSDPFTRGWTTYGVCALAPDSSVNAVWKYYPEGTIPASAYTPITTILSESSCDGAVAVHSDFNDNAGTGVGGTGSVPTSTTPNGSSDVKATYELESPAIFMGDWNVSGISVVFDQAARELRSNFSVSFRNKNTGDPGWSSWTSLPINEEFMANANPTFNKIRRFLPGAHEADSIQLKLTYEAHYYFWIVDDFKIVETECNNTRVGGEVGTPDFFAVAPWARVPTNQVYPYYVLADIYNAGACLQTNVVLNHTVTDSGGGEIYNEDLHYGDIEADSLAQNKLFPVPVEVPTVTEEYTGTYTLRQDMADFDSTDNVITYQFGVGGSEFALEDGSTRNVTPAASNYDAGAAHSYAYGNYFFPVSDATVNSILWGATNTIDMAGFTVNVLLLQWTDTNGDEISSSNERRYVGFSQYTFTGAEGEPALINTVLENFENKGDPIVMNGGFGYLAMIEYQASPGDPDLFLEASEARDYSAVNLAFDQAYDEGATTMRAYFSALGLSPDGNIAEIDYGVTASGTFGFDIVPLVRIVVDPTNTVDQLPLDNMVTVYPNPASEEISVKLEFSQPYNNVKLHLLDNVGRVVYVKTIDQTITEHVESVKVQNLAAGNYMLQVETRDGQRSIPVVVVK